MLDKRSRGQSTVQRLSFAELRPASELAEAKREALMRGRIDPSEAFLVEDVDGEDFYGVLSQTFHLPAAYFGTQLRDFLSEPRLVATANDNRKGRLSDTERWLLNRKQSVFWGRLVPTEDLPLVAIDPAPDSEA